MKLTRATFSLALVFAFIGVAPVSSSAAGAEAFHCDWPNPEYPHISSHNLRPEHGGKKDIKTSIEGSCDPTAFPVTAKATMTLELLVFGNWIPVKSGVSVSKQLQSTGAAWRRNELMAVMPCVSSGTYRGFLEVRYESPTVPIVPDFEFRYSRAVNVDCKTKRVSLVIDDTGSMGGVIGSVISSLTGYISSQPEDEYTSWSLTTFKDSPRNVGTTEERSQILNWVQALSAGGGDDCPEDALGGISAGLNALGSDPDADRQMVIATDASAHSGNVDGIIASAKAAGVRVNVLLTGDCDFAATAGKSQQDFSQRNDAAATYTTTATTESSQVVLKRIASETGGKYFFLPNGNTDDFINALNDIFADFANPAPPSSSPPATSTPGPGNLPVTGASITRYVALGLLLIGVGAVLLLRVRRSVRQRLN